MNEYTLYINCELVYIDNVTARRVLSDGSLGIDILDLCDYSYWINTDEKD